MVNISGQVELSLIFKKNNEPNSYTIHAAAQGFEIKIECFRTHVLFSQNSKIWK